MAIMQILVLTEEQVPEGTHVLSPTQTKTWMACKRKWGWGKLDHIRMPQKPGQEIGSAVHDEAENWLRDGTLPDETRVIMAPKGPRYPGRIFKAGIHLLPPPRTVLVEQKFYLYVDGVYTNVDTLSKSDLESAQSVILPNALQGG